MKNLNFSSYLVGFAAAVLLTACGGSRGQTPGAPALPAAGVSLLAPATSGDLLYIAHRVPRPKFHGVVSILTYPGAKPAGRIANIDAWGMCADTLGNVWVIAYVSGGFQLLEYAHGGTTPVAERDMPKGSFATGCAVDPASGDLAVASEKGAYAGQVDVWAGARSGKPAVHKSDFVPRYITYDDRSSLFVSGFRGGSDFWLELGALAKGARDVTMVKFDRRPGSAGGIEWDGKHVAVETGGYAVHGPPRIYGLDFSGTKARVVGETVPKDPSMHFQTLFCLLGDQMISTAGTAGNRVEVWPYPAGGTHTLYLGHFDRIMGMAISVGSAP